MLASRVPGKSVIKTDPAINGNAFWFTGRNGSYQSQERSYLYTNAFDISNLDRPLVSFNSIAQLEQSDGVVLQYSLDNKNIADNTKVWTHTGVLRRRCFSSGLEWYNAQGLASKPGNQLTKDYGWTGSSATKWTESLHSLDEITGAKRVVFRFALASVKTAPVLDGFGVDNFWLRSRTRTVLLESFTNTANTTAFNGAIAEKSQSDALKAFHKDAEGVEVIKLNYHVDFPGEDPFNSDYRAAPSSRALYYSVTGTPFVCTGRNQISFCIHSLLFTMGSAAVRTAYIEDGTGCDLNYTNQWSCVDHREWNDQLEYNCYRDRGASCQNDFANCRC